MTRIASNHARPKPHIVVRQGTSYTIGNTLVMTQRTMATNYIKETNGSSLRPENEFGPYLLDTRLPLPDRYILTKTHCFGICNTCADPYHTIVSPSTFAEKCTVDPQSDFNWTQTEPVHRVIHLIRDPLDNLVARMHLSVEKGHVGRMEYTRDGFLQWAGMMKETWNRTLELLDADVVELMDQVPCSGDLYLYVQWHNNALAMIEAQKLRTLLIYYEDYTYRYNATVESILRFLEQPIAYTPTAFTSGKRYRKFYTMDEIQAARRLVQRLASPKLWKLLRHYFEK